ncbi:MAG: hypothetical protein ACFFBD_07740 [Candidatus Hodarchaeota archaeon]
MVKGGVDPRLITQLEKLELSLFGGTLENQLFEGQLDPPPLFDDILEKVIFLIALDLALEGKAGVTSAFLAELTQKTKTTVNIRLERLYYKRLLQKQHLGKAILYYLPLYELLFMGVVKELIQLEKNLNKTPAHISEEELAKEKVLKHLSNVHLILGRSKDYFTSRSTARDLFTSLLKEKLPK